MNSRRGRGSGRILRAYNENLRPVIIVSATISGIWSLISAISAFETIHVDDSQGFPKLGTFAIVVGSMYAGACGIELFGILTASLQRLRMARIYSLLSVVSALAIVGAGFMRVILHFSLKNDLIDECVQISTGDTVFHQFGFWGPTFETKLTQSEAESYCKNHWSHDSGGEIIWLIVEIIVMGLFSTLAFGYARQLSDPTSSANKTRVPPADARMGADDAFPAHYNPPYLAYDTAPTHYNPPPGAPPGAESEYDDGATLYGSTKPPMYSEDDLGTYGGYGQGEGKSAAHKPSDPFADFDGPSVARSGSRAEDREEGLV